MLSGRWRFAVLLLVTLAGTAIAAAYPGPKVPRPGGEASPGARDVVVRMFQWPWASVSSECTDVLGPDGYGAVLVSPPQEHVVLPGKGYPWSQDYQPVSYRLDSRRGDRDAFVDMVEACHLAGVKVYVDAVVNNMAAGTEGARTSGGSTFRHDAYPAVPYGPGDFHSCPGSGTGMGDPGNAKQLRDCELAGRADLRTGTRAVRAKILRYLNDLVDIGVDGFRIDAAENVPPRDLKQLYAGLAKPVYVFQQVHDDGSTAASPKAYGKIGDVTSYRYATAVGAAFTGRRPAALKRLDGALALPPEQTVSFIDDATTRRDGTAPLTERSGPAYLMAQQFMLAFPYGTPMIDSDYRFTRPDQGPPSLGEGNPMTVTCGLGWLCEHRTPGLANMVRFHNVVASGEVREWWADPSGAQIAFARGTSEDGDRGFVVFNTAKTALTRTFHTALPPGSYCDIASGDYRPEDGTCTGHTYEVDQSGTLTVTVLPQHTLAVHVAAAVPPPSD